MFSVWQKGGTIYTFLYFEGKNLLICKINMHFINSFDTYCGQTAAEIEDVYALSWFNDPVHR